MVGTHRTNRKTKGTFRVPGVIRKSRTLEEIFDDLAFRGPYLQQTVWLKDHGFAYFGEHDTPDDRVWETWVDNFGNVVRIKWERRSNVGMEGAVIVDSEFTPAPER